MTELTQHEKIVKLMVIRPDHVWWYPYDFMRGDLGDYFVGYKAPTRLAELENKFPLMFESKREGKYIIRRFRKEGLNDFYYQLPDRMKCMMWSAGLKNSYQANLV